MSRRVAALMALALAGSPAAALPAGAQPATTSTSGGAPLAQAEKGIPKSSQALITKDQAAANDPSVHSGLSSTDGLSEPINANDAPGSERLAQNNEPDKLVTSDGEVRLNGMIGHWIYSTTGKNLGTVADILLSPHREPLVIIQFDNRTVAVPWGQLRFGLAGAMLHGRPVLPGASEHELRQLPQFSMNASGNE